MKRNLFLILIGLLSISAHSLMAAKAKGSIIKQNGIKKNVTFILPRSLFGDLDLIKLQYQLKYIDSKGKKHVLKPSKLLKEIRFTFKKESFRLFAVQNTTSHIRVFKPNTYAFLQIKSEGRINRFKFYYYEHREVDGRIEGLEQAIYLLKRENQHLYDPFYAKNPINSLRKYFNDCPMISNQIMKTTLEQRGVEYFVTEYNKFCNK